MKIAKKFLSALLAAILLITALAACEKVHEESMIEIFDTNGAGQISFMVYIPQDEGMYPQGAPSVSQYIKDKLIELGIPDADLITFSKQSTGVRAFMSGFLVPGDEDYSGIDFMPKYNKVQSDLAGVHMRFDNINDYNEKMLKIITMYDTTTPKIYFEHTGPGEWDGFQTSVPKADDVRLVSNEFQRLEADLIVEDNTVTFVASVASIAQAMSNLTAAFYENNDIFKPGNAVRQGASFGNAAETVCFSVTVGDTIQKFTIDDIVGNWRDSTQTFQVTSRLTDEKPSVTTLGAQVRLPEKGHVPGLPDLRFVSKISVADFTGFDITAMGTLLAREDQLGGKTLDMALLANPGSITVRDVPARFLNNKYANLSENPYYTFTCAIWGIDAPERKYVARAYVVYTHHVTKQKITVYGDPTIRSYNMAAAG